MIKYSDSYLAHLLFSLSEEISEGVTQLMFGNLSFKGIVENSLIFAGERPYVDGANHMLVSDLRSRMKEDPVLADYDVQVLCEAECQKILRAAAGKQLLPVGERRFHNFVVGQSNLLAYTAALKVAESPGGAFNPLTVYSGGQHGTGKTHLLLAIANDLEEQGYRAAYMTATQFTLMLINAIMTDTLAEQRAYFGSLDCLVLDDLEFVAGKNSTMIELYGTIVRLTEKRVQVVFGSSMSIDEIQNMNPRIVSLCHAGLLVDVQPMDDDTAKAFVEKKAEEADVRLSNEEIDEILKGRRDARYLMGALNRIRMNRSSADR